MNLIFRLLDLMEENILIYKVYFLSKVNYLNLIHFITIKL